MQQYCTQGPEFINPRLCRENRVSECPLSHLTGLWAPDQAGKA